MTRVHIRFASDILRRLGEELNPSVDQGIIELVKNSYDADARECTVELSDVENPGGAIRVVDDGVGMDVEDIANAWLVVGRSSKSTRERTKLGRIPAGSKGLGRLAALRLGRFATMRTTPRNASVDYELKIDWDRFDNADTVEEIPLAIEERQRDGGRTSGTEIRLEGLRRGLSRTEVRSLARSMILLGDPFSEDPNAFRPRLLASEFADLEQLVQNRYFTEAEYRLAARLHPDGTATGQVLDWRGELLYEADHSELRRGADGLPYRAPPAQFDLWVYLLTGAAFTTRDASIGEVRRWLAAFGGVHLYVNGLRVAPYGNPANDWLEMNLSRARSPEERPSTNTSIGRVAVADPTGLLVQKTDRSGVIEDEQFSDLRRFCQEALEWMARRRLDEAEKRRHTERKVATTGSSKAREGLEEQIERVPEEQRATLVSAYRTFERALQRETDALRREVQLYRTLSTAGITAATFAHESAGNPIKVITQSVAAIERRAKRDLGADLGALAEPIAALRRAVKSLGALGSATLRLLAPDKRRVGRVDLHEALGEVVGTYQAFTQTRDIAIDVQLAPGSPYIRGTEAAVESIISNLLNNSLAAFEQANGGSRRILLETEVIEDVFRLRVADSGPGISGISLHDLWLPGETTRPGGTGLGLSIVRDAASDLGGSVEAIATGVLGGAEFVIELPLAGR